MMENGIEETWPAEDTKNVQYAIADWEEECQASNLNNQ